MEHKDMPGLTSTCLLPSLPYLAFESSNTFLTLLHPLASTVSVWHLCIHCCIHRIRVYNGIYVVF
jgi:hypothetical protein